MRAAAQDQATQKCIEQKPLVRAYDPINMKRALISGVPLVQGWDGWLLMALPALASKRMQYVLPLEGCDIYQDCYCIPVGAPSPYAAHLLVGFLMDPKVAAETINYSWYHTPIPQAKQWVDKIVLSFEPNEEELKRGQQETDLGAFTEKPAEAWQKIKSASSRVQKLLLLLDKEVESRDSVYACAQAAFQCVVSSSATSYGSTETLRLVSRLSVMESKIQSLAEILPRVA